MFIKKKKGVLFARSNVRAVRCMLEHVVHIIRKNVTVLIDVCAIECHETMNPLVRVPFAEVRVPFFGAAMYSNLFTMNFRRRHIIL